MRARNVLAEFGLQADPDVTDADLADLEGNYDERGGFFELLEEAEGNLLGSVRVYKLDSMTCELSKMYFSRSIRGQGLGKYLMQRTIRRARALGFKRIVLETSSKLEIARHLYVNSGFRPTTSAHLASRADEASN